MAIESDVSIRSNRLLLDGEPLSAEKHTPRDLTFVLGALGREAITHAIEDSFNETKAKNPGASVKPPSILAMDLGRNKKNVLTAFGQRNRTALHRSVVEVRPPFHDHWNAITGFDLAPEIWSNVGSRSTATNWLMLRNPETDPLQVTPLDALPVALGFIEPAITNELRPELRAAWVTGDADTYKALRTKYLDASYEAMDRQRDSFDEPMAYELAGIGQIIASANLRVEIEGDAYLLDPDGYEAALTDADESAYHHYENELNEILQAEVERIRGLRENS
jgi:hypothetical protein